VPIELLNPDGLPKPDVYAQVAVATGSRTVYVAGQVARTAEGEPVGPGDLAAQIEQEAGVDPVRPITLIGVTALGEPDLLVEIEAIAVLP
jgi:enamine deaminase RidA (YjgF/YER057c/UK114 family)